MSATLPDLRLDIAAPDVDPILRAATLVGDRTRAGILAMLGDGPHCEIAAALGERQNNVSNHLAQLREAGLVRTVRGSVDSRRVYYERDDSACRAALAALASVLT